MADFPFGMRIYDSLIYQDPKEAIYLVYRHGDRVPAVIYPLDMHQVNNTEDWSQGLGWLTKLGIQEHFAFGKFLRRRYDSFITKKYISTEINVESSSVSRCLMSAYSNLAGLFPPVPSQKWNPDIDWQPIPVSMISDSDDNKLHLSKDCPRYSQLYSDLLQSEMVQKEEMKNKAFYQFVMENTGVKHENISNIWEVVDTLICEKAHRLPWNSWVNETVFEKLLSLYKMDFILQYYTEEMARLKGGPLLKQFISNMKSKIHGHLDEQMKMFMYSAHDETIVALLSALGLYDGNPPVYTSAVIMELHKENEKYNVQLFYKNFTSHNVSDSREPVRLTMKGCDFICPLETFLELTKHSVPKNWTEECKMKTSFSPTIAKATIIAACLTAAVVGGMFTMMVIMLVQRRRSQRAHISFYKFTS